MTTAERRSYIVRRLKGMREGSETTIYGFRVRRISRFAWEAISPDGITHTSDVAYHILAAQYGDPREARRAFSRR